MRTVTLSLLLLLIMTALPASAWFPRDDAERTLRDKGKSPVIGSNRYYQIAEGETLIQLARAFGLGYQGVVRANPGIDPWLPRPGKQIVLPYATVLPSGLKPGITVNLAEFKLYFLEDHDGERSVRIYPVGIGVEGWETPLGSYRILKKAEKPTWNVPAVIRAEKPSLPKLVPPGPDNPLGDFWMAFTGQQHGIHGTNEPYGVGRRVSHGCIRLYPEDIKDLYRRVPVGTPVNVIYEPIKLGLRNGELYLEVHQDYLGNTKSVEEVVRQQCAAIGCRTPYDTSQIRFAAESQLGYPLNISSGLNRVADSTR